MDTAGDSVLATFDSVVEAVECAVAVQNDLARRFVPYLWVSRPFYEAGLQELLLHNPQVLPVDEIEPAFGPQGR